jgi:branched-chain amino acid transport system substrate-binding protein
VKTRVAILIVLALFLVLGSCQTPPPPKQTGTGSIMIAILAPLSSPGASCGVSERNGALLAVNQWNDKGGVLGRRVETIVENSECEAIQAKAKAKWVISVKNARFIVGEVCSVATIPASDLADDEGVVMISPASANPRVTLKSGGMLKLYVFRTCFIDSLQGQIAARFAHDNLGKRTAAVLSNKSFAYSGELAEAFVKHFNELGGRVVVNQEYSEDYFDFTDVVKVVAASKAEILYVPDAPGYVNRIAAQAKKIGLTAILMGGDAWDAPALNKESAEGGYYTTRFSSSDARPVAQKWVDEYRMAYGSEPDAIACLSFDAMNIILAAIEKAGTDDPSFVKTIIAENRWDAVSGPISFDAEHNPIKPGAVMQVKKGGDVFVASVGR